MSREFFLSKIRQVSISGEIMMKMRTLIIGLLLLIPLLAACNVDDDDAGTGSAAVEEADQAVASGNSAAIATTALAGDDAAAPAVADSQLGADYAGALSVMGQLALGIVQLDESDLAVDEVQAAELLPLWQALQSLSQSDTTAAIELEAVVNQIQSTLSSEQVAAIAGMRLSGETVTELMESGELGFGGFGRGTGERSGSGNGAGFRGGGPGGGILGGPGGGPGGGLGGFGAPPGGFSEEDMATRQAQVEAGGTAAMQERLLMGMVVRLLEDKTGVVSERQLRGQIMNEAFSVVAEAAGLSVEELSAQTAAGRTLAEIVEANGGDVAALAENLEALFVRLPEAEEIDLQQATAEWLGIVDGA